MPQKEPLLRALQTLQVLTAGNLRPGLSYEQFQCLLIDIHGTVYPKSELEIYIRYILVIVTEDIAQEYLLPSFRKHYGISPAKYRKIAYLLGR